MISILKKLFYRGPSVYIVERDHDYGKRVVLYKSKPLPEETKVESADRVWDEFFKGGNQRVQNTTLFAGRTPTEIKANRLRDISLELEIR